MDQKRYLTAERRSKEFILKIEIVSAGEWQKLLQKNDVI